MGHGGHGGGHGGHGSGHGEHHHGGGYRGFPGGYGYYDSYQEPTTIIVERDNNESYDSAVHIATENINVYNSDGKLIYTLASGQKFRAKGMKDILSLGQCRAIEFAHDNRMYDGYVKIAGESLGSGLSVSSDGTKIVGDNPDYEIMIPVADYTPAQKSRAADWWAVFAQALNTTPATIWANRDFSCSAAEQAGLVIATTPDFGGNNDKTVGLINWLGGGGTYLGFWGKKPCWANSTDYLDAAKIVTEGTVGTYNIADLLLELKAVNPVAHMYIIYKAFAKAKKMKLTNDQQYHSVENPNVKAAIKSAEKFSDSVAGVPKTVIDAATGLVDGAKSGIQTAGWFAEHWYVIPIGITVVVGGTGYLLWRNRKEVMEVANTAAKFTPAGRAMSAAKLGGA